MSHGPATAVDARRQRAAAVQRSRASSRARRDGSGPLGPTTQGHRAAEIRCGSGRSRPCAGTRPRDRAPASRTRRRAERHPERSPPGRLASTSGGQPFHSATNVLPMKRRSSTPILLDQKPEATRSRKSVKNAAPGLHLRPAPSPARRCRRGAAVRSSAERRPRSPCRSACAHSRSSQARPPRTRVCSRSRSRTSASGSSRMKSMNSGHERVGGAARALVRRDHDVGERRAPSPTRAR